jgi:uncharacterized alpha-E superfamily protein
MMKQLLTANVANNLYWLGRYLERIEYTLERVIGSYDQIIDEDSSCGKELYKTFGIEIDYINATDFLYKSMLGEHASNLFSLASYARENAIISRNKLNSDMFGEVIALHALFQNASKSHVEIDYKLIDHAQSLISEVWGELSKRKYKQESDYFIRLGKLVEEADFCFRFNESETRISHVIHDIFTILEILADEESSSTAHIEKTKYSSEVLEDIYSKIQKIIVE